MKTKQEKIIWRRIHEKEEGLKARLRKRKLLYLKHTGELGNYFNQKRGVSIKKETIRSSEGSGIPPKNHFQRFVKGISSLSSSYILKCKRFFVTFVAKKLKKEPSQVE